MLWWEAPPLPVLDVAAPGSPQQLRQPDRRLGIADGDARDEQLVEVVGLLEPEREG